MKWEFERSSFNEFSPSILHRKQPLIRFHLSFNQVAFFLMKCHIKEAAISHAQPFSLDSAKRKEEWLIEELRKFEVPKALEEIYYSKYKPRRSSFTSSIQVRKNYVPVGR
ncbi:uncharacterized protein LOC131257403 [Magnolia sinica]|uniref:uncharacterized protein LOC131257403 n=1 Tax=Magnolia sinica TaxID=86752 RepID=UPI002658D13C|nr:uncharacterized protein LOC131257403 [Magnolia sinica]